MNNREIENNVYQAFTKLEFEDQLSSILSECKKSERRVMVMEDNKNNNSLVFRFAGLALAFTIILASLVFYNFTQRSNGAVAATISLDVNPSIEIQINKNERVLDVLANNEDAKIIIGDMDFKGSDLKVTVNALIGSLLRNGYLNDEANSILVSVKDIDTKEGTSLEERLMKEISDLLENGSVLCQKFNEDEETLALAEKYNITLGKALLVKEIVEESKIYAYEDLAKLSINELNLLKKNNETNIQRNGQPSDKAYIGIQKAKEIALNHAGLKESDVRLEKAELDFERGRMVYEVEFDYNRVEYEYLIDASSGEIIDFITENDADYYQQNNQTNNNQTSNNQSNQNSYVGIDAKQIAFNHAGVNESQVTNLKIKKEYDDGIVKYEIDFMVGNVEYDYEINANTGAILEFEKEEHAQKPAASDNSNSNNIQSYKVENGQVYEYDDGKWELEDDKKVENGVVYEKDDGQWQPEEKTENNITYEYDDDTNSWEADKKVENGITYEYDDDTGTWEVDDDD